MLQAARSADVKDSRLLAAIGAMLNGQRAMLEMSHATLGQLLSFASSARLHDGSVFEFARRFYETRLPPPTAYTPSPSPSPSPSPAPAEPRSSASTSTSTSTAASTAGRNGDGGAGATARVPDINLFENSTEQPPRLKEVALAVRTCAHFLEPLHPNLRAFALHLLRRTLAHVREQCGDFGSFFEPFLVAQ